jgi:hypothetical protein
MLRDIGWKAIEISEMTKFYTLWMMAHEVRWEIR